MQIFPPTTISLYIAHTEVFLATTQYAYILLTVCISNVPMLGDSTQQNPTVINYMHGFNAPATASNHDTATIMPTVQTY